MRSRGVNAKPQCKREATVYTRRRSVNVPYSWMAYTLIEWYRRVASGPLGVQPELACSQASPAALACSHASPFRCHTLKRQSVPKTTKCCLAHLAAALRRWWQVCLSSACPRHVCLSSRPRHRVSAPGVLQCNRRHGALHCTCAPLQQKPSLNCNRSLQDIKASRQ